MSTHAEETLTGVRLKLRRAWHHTNSLKADITAFLDGRPYAPAVHFDRQTARLTVKLNVEKSPDRMWSIRIGDVVHNFRSALDHLIWELAGRPKRPGTKVQFPIFQTEAGFSSRKDFVKGVPGGALAIITSEQPFSERDDGTIEGLNSPLWQLKELSDIDKHRRIHLTACTLASHHFRFPPVALPFQPINVYEHPAGLVEQDTVVWSGTLVGATEWPFEKGNIEGHLEVEIAFREGAPFENVWGVNGTLARIGNRVEHVIRRITETVFETEL